jgi:AAA family ATP:ADP antiporter
MSTPPTPTTPSDLPRRSGLLERVLRPFAEVHADEGPVAVLMAACVFLILTSYYLMKTAREGLILAGGTFGLGGDELKTYASGAMALLFVGIVPAYGRLASRVRRIRLINVSYAIVMVCLGAFFVLGRLGAPVGLPFFIWLGLVNVFLVAQFWSYANDLYTEEQGKRLFAIIAAGGALGAICGPYLAKLADTFTVMLIAAAILAGCIALFNVIERTHRGRVHDEHIAAAPIQGRGGFELVLRDRYLLLIGVMMLVLNLVNTTGEYVLSNAVRDHAYHVVPATAHADLAGAARAAAIEADRRELIKAFYADFFAWVNLVGFLIQAFLVSRVIQRIGVRGALFVLPLIAFGAYGAIGLVGGIALVRAAKIAENSTDYSLQNTVRQALFLPTSRAVKYKAKAAIDTFFVRAGDTMSALLVGFGVHQLGLGGTELALVNTGLVVIWLGFAAGIARHHRRLSAEAEAREAREAHEAVRDMREPRDAREPRRPALTPRPALRGTGAIAPGRP